MSGATVIPAFEASPYDYGEALEIAHELGLTEPVAIALVRRGHRSVESARAFLAADERHPPSAFAGIDRAAAAVRRALEAGERITVHGDYDVDGISATAILVSALRGAGAECDWLIPDRLADGYGLTLATVERLAERDTRLLITVDCGIGCAAEVAAARERGIEVVVTDHHQPGEELPDCAIVHPEVSGYPFAGLCGAAVAHKLVEALREAGIAVGEDRDLDLVALATVADLVPLVGENRRLAREGIAELRRCRRPGLRALCASASVEPERLDEGDIAFRLAPRINAAGRLYRADAGVELMLTEDLDRARAIAAELDAANRERRETEREVLHAAEAALRALEPEQREAPGLVLAGEGWHPGVVGIVASRIAERHGRPAVLLALDGSGRARGSGRSIPGFDLLAALEACAEHLDRFGGHRAAAGVELAADRVEAFREAFAAHAAAAMPEGPPQRVERVDAVVGADGLGIEVAEQLDRLGPFGLGNPEVRLLVPWARVGSVEPMGEEGRHSRFDLRTGASRARAVAFNANGKVDAATRRPSDLTVRLELNHWNGSIEPRAVLAATSAGSEPSPERASSPCACPPAPGEEWWERFERELERDLEAPAQTVASSAGRRRVLDAAGRSPVALVAELVSSGGRVLALAADAARRSELALLAASPARFGGSEAVACGSCPSGSLAAAAEGEASLVLSDWRALAAEHEAAEAFAHLVAVDPPADPVEEARALAGAGYLHRAWAARGDDLAELCWDALWDLRSPLAEIYREAAGGGEPLAAERLSTALAGRGRYLRPAEVAARAVRVLGELGIAQIGGSPGTRSLVVVSSERTELQRSRAWRACAARHEEGRLFLERRRARS